MAGSLCVYPLTLGRLRAGFSRAHQRLEIGAAMFNTQRVIVPDLGIIMP
jgi:hypothetical protein